MLITKVDHLGGFADAKLLDHHLILLFGDPVGEKEMVEFLRQ
jgi:hypothetical protein